MYVCMYALKGGKTNTIIVVQEKNLHAACDCSYNIFQSCEKNRMSGLLFCLLRALFRVNLSTFVIISKL